MTEKEEPTLISTEGIVKRLCKSGTHRPPGAITLHRKGVFSDGWTRWVCSNCGARAVMDLIVFTSIVDNRREIESIKKIVCQ